MSLRDKLVSWKIYSLEVLALKKVNISSIIFLLVLLKRNYKKVHGPQSYLLHYSTCSMPLLSDIHFSSLQFCNYYTTNAC